ncbi:hypothetical protein [Thiocystis minor]|uniref:restriction endonuclease subunit S n=1 Tax=Thiocystis minor TaxID=61597 RepID=UPI001A9327CA|nr:hypothetical protein [Thiocystis minor]
MVSAVANSTPASTRLPDARNHKERECMPEGWENVVVTSHFKVYTPDISRLDARFFRLLLQTKDFKNWLWANRSGADGRTEVKLDVFEMLEIPLPPIREQTALCDAYSTALYHAPRLEQEAQTVEDAGVSAFETALGVAAPPPPPERLVFVARFRDIERWSHEGILRAALQPNASTTRIWPVTRLGNVVADLENVWSPKCHDHQAGKDRWGVLKLGAVSFGIFDQSQNKELPERLSPRAAYEVKSGDVLISRANVVRYVGACVHIEETRSRLMLCDKIFRLRFRENSRLLPRFLPEVMRLCSVREQIEARLTGTSPTMKNISKPALLDLSFPLPELEDQQALITDLTTARQTATAKRAEARALRASAWTAFESALFATGDLPEHQSPPRQEAADGSLPNGPSAA